MNWKPTINTIQPINLPYSYRLTGYRLNGINEGAAYTDDGQMNTNYPLIRYTNVSNGQVTYGAIGNWNNTGVEAPGDMSVAVTATITVPPGLLTPNSTYLVEVVTNGLASDPWHVTVSQYGVPSFLPGPPGPGGGASAPELPPNAFLGILNEPVVLPAEGALPPAVQPRIGGELPLQQGDSSSERTSVGTDWGATVANLLASRSKLRAFTANELTFVSISAGDSGDLVNAVV